MKLSAVIITYYPDLNTLLINIKSFIRNVDKLIIWENTPLIDRDKYRFDLSVYEGKVILMGTGINIGIASALNNSIKWSIDNKYSHILTMDQDSFFEETHFVKYIDSIKSYLNDNIGVYSPNINYNGHLSYDLKTSTKQLNLTITSGAIHPLKIFSTTGLFREDFFIDAVDYEFCFRIQKIGFKIIVFTNIILNQQFGYTTKTKLGFKTLNYSSARTYYIIRNHIILWRQYPKLYENKSRFILHHIILRIPKVILAESQKKEKIKAILLGLKDGFMGITGQRKM
jgi:rhamnosyltransferase